MPNTLTRQQLIDAITAAIYTNTSGAITGNVLRDAVIAVVDNAQLAAEMDDYVTGPGLTAALTAALTDYVRTENLPAPIDVAAVIASARTGMVTDQQLADGLATKTTDSTLAAVAKTGSYNDLFDKPSIPASGGGGIPEAPNNANAYGRKGGAWVVIPPPADTSGFALQTALDSATARIGTLEGRAPGIGDAPNDGKSYLRRNLAWMQAPAAGASINDSTTAASTTWSSSKIAAQVQAAVAGVLDGSPAAMDTLKELATALGNDANFATTTATALGNRVRYDAAQTIPAPAQAVARGNIGAVGADAIGNPDTDFAAIFTSGLL